MIPTSPKWPTRSQKAIIATVILTTLLLLFLSFLASARPAPRIEITLVTIPVPQLDPWVFYSAEGGPFGTGILITQACYRAELQIKNHGPGTVYFPNSSMYFLEIQRANSTAWEPMNQNILYGGDKMKPGQLLLCPQMIPHDAAKWRVRTAYRRLYDPRDYVNAFIVDVLKIEHRVGTEKVFESQSEVWKLPSQNWSF